MSAETKRLRPGAWLPSVFVGAAWLALWSLWPMGSGRPFSWRPPSHTKFFYAGHAVGDANRRLQPDLFIRSSGLGYRFLEEDNGVAEGLSGQRLHASRFLERDYARAESLLSAAWSPAIPVKALGLAGIQIEPRIPRAYTAAPDLTMRVLARASAELEEGGFEMPELPGELTTLSDKPWLAVMGVEFGDEGRPEHVFLEAGTSSKEINAILVKTLLKAPPLKSTGTRAGRVTVNFGCR